jgi:hypothetical protein
MDYPYHYGQKNARLENKVQQVRNKEHHIKDVMGLKSLDFWIAEPELPLARRAHLSFWGEMARLYYDDAASWKELKA